MCIYYHVCREKKHELCGPSMSFVTDILNRMEYGTAILPWGGKLRMRAERERPNKKGGGVQSNIHTFNGEIVYHRLFQKMCWPLLANITF
jgi:hypothetical protein